MTLSWDVIIAEAARQGWRRERRTRHLCLRAPSGSGAVTISTTPGDQRAILGCLADMRRLGLQWQGSHTPPKRDRTTSVASVEVVVERPRDPRPAGEAVYATIVGAGRPLSPHASTVIPENARGALLLDDDGSPASCAG